ncbi:MAG: hypothetical protein DRJ97_00515 [Thermoprotei archaeon]|nr:MAG: hypothetical protein DRJ97_00515 [Thermoprotei archaeon]
MRLVDIMCLRPCIYWDDPLITALSIMAGKSRQSPYRVVVVNSNKKVKGVITGRRVLEVILGKRGTSLVESKGIAKVLRENVSLFIDEPHNVFVEHMPPQAVIQYMAENKVGFVIVIDDNWVLQGMVDDSTVLSRLRGEVFGVPVKDVMTSRVYHISPESSLMEAASLMTDLRVRRLPVVHKGELAGIITVTDLLNYLLIKEKHVEMLLHDVGVEEVFSEKVKDVMSKEVLAVSPHDDVSRAIEIMTDRDVSGLPVTSNNGELVGLVSRIDVLAGLTNIKGATTVLDLMVSQLVC